MGRCTALTEGDSLEATKADMGWIGKGNQANGLFRVRLAFRLCSARLIQGREILISILLVVNPLQ